MDTSLYYKKIKYVYLQKEKFYTSISTISNSTISKKLLKIKNLL